MLQSKALQILERAISSCDKCEDLSNYRRASNYKTVPGTGAPNSDLMIIGEAPGRNEAEQGEPFVGKAGRLLTNILEAAGWKRSEVYITNILKCRPPENRDPEILESNNCRKFLNMQIKCVNPKWIICFGRIASMNLLGAEDTCTMGEFRGKIHEYHGKKVVCTFHPSYLLRNPSAKKDVWNDIKPVIFALQSNL